MVMSVTLPTPRPRRLRHLNDFEVGVEGLRSMLLPFSDRIRIVETDVNDTADRDADLTLYDTFGLNRSDEGEIDDALRDINAGHVVVYTWNMHPELVGSALDKGCRGYLDKSMPATALVESLEAIHRGETVVSGESEVSGSAGDTGAAEQPAWPGQDEGLTAREAEIIAQVTRGLTNVEIAALNFITINTVKSRIRSAYRKMGVERRPQAVRWGMEHGMTPAVAQKE